MSNENEEPVTLDINNPVFVNGDENLLSVMYSICLHNSQDNDGEQDTFAWPAALNISSGHVSFDSERMKDVDIMASNYITENIMIGDSKYSVNSQNHDLKMDTIATVDLSNINASLRIAKTDNPRIITVSSKAFGDSFNKARVAADTYDSKQVSEILMYKDGDITASNRGISFELLDGYEPSKNFVNYFQNLTRRVLKKDNSDIGLGAFSAGIREENISIIQRMNKTKSLIEDAEFGTNTVDILFKTAQSVEAPSPHTRKIVERISKILAEIIETHISTCRAERKSSLGK